MVLAQCKICNTYPSLTIGKTLQTLALVTIHKFRTHHLIVRSLRSSATIAQYFVLFRNVLMGSRDIYTANRSIFHFRGIEACVPLAAPDSITLIVINNASCLFGEAGTQF